MSEQHYHPHDKAGNPYGKLFPDDQGGLAVMVTIKDDHLVLNFGKEITWLALHKEGVKQLIKVLQEKVKEL